MSAEYAFVTRWSVDASEERCWAEFERMLLSDTGESWWPGFEIVERPSRLAVGEELTLSVRSPLGYGLRVRVTITAVERGSEIAAASVGDLRGTGRVVIEPDGAGTTVTFHWNVVTEKAWMNATAGILRPAFERAHAHVMAAGEKGFREALERG
jgi:hypothetical protein